MDIFQSVLAGFWNCRYTKYKSTSPKRRYQKLLSYYQPQILLGLTATPERMDGKSVLPYFSNRIAAEIRLPEAIDRRLLCPFQYFGVTDTVDLDTLKWSAGGYDKGELSNLYTLSGAVANRRADLVVSSLLKYVTDIDEIKGLGFCVSIEHAAFMCRYFTSHGIPSIFLTGKSSDGERNAAKGPLVSGEVRFLFVVDIYNEGVDIPEVNTVLFLRPTESLTIFLQQLGRGLRLAEGKECLTVLDFIGQANKRYHFEDKFAALLSNTTRSVTREIKDGFVSAPKGCYIQLEKKAAKYILDNIRASYGNTAGLVSRVASFAEDSGLALTLANFLDYSHLDPRAIYKFSSSHLRPGGCNRGFHGAGGGGAHKSPCSVVRCGLPALYSLFAGSAAPSGGCGLCSAQRGGAANAPDVLCDRLGQGCGGLGIRCGARSSPCPLG